MKHRLNMFLTVAVVFGLISSTGANTAVSFTGATDFDLSVAGSPASNSSIGDCFAVIGSNSTVTDLAFNQTSSEFTFTVTGASGTTGYMWCKIAEDLIPHKDTSKHVTVFLDGEAIEYMFTFDDGAWELYFEYNHSSHEVVISVPKQAPTFLGVELSSWAVMLAVGVTIAVVAVWWRRKQNPTATQ
ncbi:MAG: hypothetical protein NWF04_00155 [Candidatus Bathyarchaeota archaeon]|nr:hypothetical protein [Candidatus Bathyarchaeota archaeon]